VRFLAALAALGCVYPAQVRDEHPVETRPTDRQHPYGPELLWLDATASGNTIEIQTQLARGCLRDMVDTVEAHIHREAKIGFPEHGEVRLDALLIIVPSLAISGMVTGVVLLFSGHEDVRYDRPGQPARETCVRPAPHVRLHVDFSGERSDLETDDAGVARFRPLIPTIGHVFIATDRPGEPVLAFDYDPAKPQTAIEHPEPPPPVLP
jgi:hypothetical protein